MESVERVWVLRAIDERWQRHLVEMQVLRNSVNVRAFGQLDPMEEYRIDGALADLRTVFASRRDQWLNESGREMGAFPHYLPGATGDAIKTALIAGDAMPLQTPLPGLEARPEVITAALQGVEIVDMNPLTNPAKVTDTEPEAREEEVAARVERRMEFSRGQASLEEKGRRGAF